MMIKKTLYIFIAMIIMAACTKDSEDGNANSESAELVPITFSIGTRAVDAGNAPAGFSLEDIDSLGSDNELINSYFVIFVHAAGSNNGRIASIISRDASRTQPVQWEQIETVIPEGNYTVYAFANVSQEEVQTAAKSTFYVNAKMPDLSNVAWTFAPTRDGNTLVPMSNVMSVNFSSHANPGFAIEVVRIIGKVQFFFRNLTASSLTVTDYKVTPLCDKGYLFRKGVSPIPQIPASSNQNVAFAAGMTEAEALSLPNGSENYVTSSAFMFYTSESHITPNVHPTEHYVMTFNLKRKYGTEEVVEEQRYALTPNVFSYIRRNQYILQPITFTDWVIEPQARFYPPIGGYPEVELESEDSYRECYARFSSPADGVFVINPFLRNLTDPDNIVYLTDKTYVEDYSIDVDDIDGIFTVSGIPAFKSGEILGTFNGAKGRAKVTFNVTIKVSDTLSRLYQRNLYIINK